MEAQHIDKYLGTDGADATFHFASRLVAEMLREESEDLVIKAASGDFYYDSSSTIELTDRVDIEISRADFSETGVRSVLTMSGWLKTTDHNRYSFSLCFVMRRNIPVIPKIETHLETVSGQTLSLSFMLSSNRLHDALFCMRLDQNDIEEDASFGTGRGYLMFARN